MSVLGEIIGSVETILDKDAWGIQKDYCEDVKDIGVLVDEDLVNEDSDAKGSENENEEPVGATRTPTKAEDTF